MNTANYNLALDHGWKFHLGQVRRFKELKHPDTYNACKAGGALGSMNTFLNQNYWQSVEVPHDWQTSLPYDPGQACASGYKERGVGWYYLKFKLPDSPIENARLVFEGVLGQCVVYVNGIVATRNFSGYNRFTCQIESYLLPGAENMIALYVDATTWEAWSYEGAGLYRPVYIEFRENVRLDTYGCFVRGQEKDGIWEVAADLKVLGLNTDGENTGNDNIDNLKMISGLEAPDGKVIAQEESPAAEQLKLRIPVENPKLWSPETPALYTFSCELKRGDECLASLRVSVGLRNITWCPDTGMYLNGENYPVKGICCHQDHGGVGAAATSELMEYRIMRLKALGINAYRCAHHAPSETLLYICDRLGMMVMVENRHYSVSEDVLKQLESLVLLSRNHPSVFLYSLFNEEPWQAERRGFLMARQMRALVRSLDDTRAVTAAMNGGNLTDVNASDAIDVVGVNYHLCNYEELHRRKPDKAILGTENCPTFATRGVYVTDKEVPVYGSYGDDWADYFSESMTETMEHVAEHSYNAGCFAWSGFDSYGEPQPHSWPSIMSHWGVMDICGFPKDTAYQLAAWYKEELCVHLMPHWNWAEGQEVRVCAFTNADTAELFVNGRTCGEQQVDKKRVEWKVPFEAGEIRVLVRRGEEEAFEEIRTAGEPAKLVLEDMTPEGSGSSIRIINISVTDEQGTFIPDFEKRVNFCTLGTAILGVANGNPNGLQPNVDSGIELFHGRAQVIITAGAGTVTAYCEGLPNVIL